MSERFVIWGAGGHGRAVRDLLVACGDAVVGYVDAAPDRRAEAADGLPVAGEDALEGAVLPFGGTAVALGIGDNGSRLAAFERAGARFRMPARVHPGVFVGSSVQIGEGSLVLPGATIVTAATIGDAVIVNTRAVVEHDCRVGHGAHLSPGAILCGGVSVGALGWIGAGAIVTPGARIGLAGVVGAGSVVLSDVPDHGRVVGNPARPIGRT